MLPTQKTKRRWLLASISTMIATVIASIFAGNKNMAQADPRKSNRYTRGLETLKCIVGADYNRALRPLETFFPELARLSVEYPFGDIMSRPGLELKEREIANVAALTAMGSVRSPLKYHIHGMLNVGCSPQEVVETIIHAVVYAGFPAAQDGMKIAREVFAERKIKFKPVSARPKGDRFQLGIQNLRQTGGTKARTITSQFTNIAPDLSRLTVEFAHGEIWNRSGLSLKSRELATLAMLIAIGNHDSTIRYHIEGAIRAGATETEVKELLLQMTVYAGYPKTFTVLATAQSILIELRQQGVSDASPQSDLNSQRQAETNEARYERGVDALNKISKASGTAVVKSFEDIAPDLGRYILEFTYGDVFSRPNLDLKTREIATVSALTALGTTASELPLNVHINGALNTRASRQEIVEAISHMLPYAGFVKVQQAMAIAQVVFQERGDL